MSHTVEIKETKQVEVAMLRVFARVRYWEDGKLNGQEDVNGDMPFRSGDLWCPIIDLEAGKIIDWPSGNTASLHYKVCDAGEYSLLGVDGNFVKKIDGYVPKIMCPADNGYGDYIIMNIDDTGKIAGWDVTLDEWEESDDE
jgi:hypothetical protein